MKYMIRKLVVIVAIALLPASMSWANPDELAQAEAGLEETAKDPKFADQVKTKYGLTDEQMKAMNDAGLKGPHLAMTAQLAASSGKPIDDVIKKRIELKMGWGKIAKELGVHPGEIGKSVSSLKREHSEQREQQKEMKKEARNEAKELRRDAKEERKQLREERKAERKEKREERKAEPKEKS